MKKFAIISVCFLAFSLMANAQFKLGIRAGLTSSSISAKDLVVPSQYNIETLNNAKVGFQFGLVSQIAFSGMFIQPELLLSTAGGEVKVTDVTSGNASIQDQKFTKVDIPVLVGAKMGPLRLGVGPVASIVLHSKSELTDYKNFDDKFKTATWGYQLGIGLNVWKLGLDVKYEGNLSAIGNKINIGSNSYSFDRRIHQFIFGVAYFF